MESALTGLSDLMFRFRHVDVSASIPHTIYLSKDVYTHLHNEIHGSTGFVFNPNLISTNSIKYDILVISGCSVRLMDGFQKKTILLLNRFESEIIEKGISHWCKYLRSSIPEVHINLCERTSVDINEGSPPVVSPAVEIVIRFNECRLPEDISIHSIEWPEKNQNFIYRWQQ